MGAKLITTDLKNNRIWDARQIEFGDTDPVHRVSVYPNMVRQTFYGFGGAFTEAAADCYRQL